MSGDDTVISDRERLLLGRYLIARQEAEEAAEQRVREEGCSGNYRRGLVGFIEHIEATRRMIARGEKIPTIGSKR